mgnify:CR=1 FL=1
MSTNNRYRVRGYAQTVPPRRVPLWPLAFGGALLTALILGVGIWQGVGLARSPQQGRSAPAPLERAQPAAPAAAVPAAVNPAVAQPDAPVGDIWARYEHPTAYRVLVRTAQNDYLYVCLDGGCEHTEQEAETLRSAVYARGGSAVVVTPRGHVPGGASVAARPGWGGYPANGPTPRPMDDDKTLARVTLQATAGGK